MRPRLIPNETVPGNGMPQFERFERFVAMIIKVPKEETDKLRGGHDKSSAHSGKPAKRKIKEGAK